MKESMQLFFLLLILQGCEDSSGQKFNFTEGGLTPKANGISSAVKEFKIISQTRWEISDVDYPGNIIFDGIRIIIPIKYNLSFPGDKVTYQYFSTDLNSQGPSNSTYVDIGSNYGHFNQVSNGATIGKSALFWGTSSAIKSDKLSVRDNATGTLESTTDINFASFGCKALNGARGPVTYCNGNYYGVCDFTDTNFRIFSFNKLGVVQSAITKTHASRNAYEATITGLACYDNSRLLALARGTIFKYDLNFVLIAKARNSDVVDATDITTDGRFLYLKGGATYKAPNTFSITKASLGLLE